MNVSNGLAGPIWHTNSCMKILQAIEHAVDRHHYVYIFQVVVHWGICQVMYGVMIAIPQRDLSKTNIFKSSNMYNILKSAM
jgi:NADH:ubiquinone oxidoreductase subunit 4 (subunit M)